jgi:hypothetical protein
LVTGTGNQPGGLALDEIRVELATRLMEQAGEARALAARQERWAVFEAVGREVWLSAWDQAVERVAAVVLERLRTAIEAEATSVKMPRRSVEKLLPHRAERYALRARLASAGAPLVAVLDRLAVLARDAATATPAERASLEQWQETLKAAARKLEAAWLALEKQVEEEVQGSQETMRLVARWRRPLWPVVLAALAGLGAVLWLGLVLGGYLPFPNWLRELWTRLPLTRLAR